MNETWVYLEDMQATTDRSLAKHQAWQTTGAPRNERKFKIYNYHFDASTASIIMLDSRGFRDDHHWTMCPYGPRAIPRSRLRSQPHTSGARRSSNSRPN